MTIATLPMYDLPQLTEATDAFYGGLSRWLETEDIADVP